MTDEPNAAALLPECTGDCKIDPYVCRCGFYPSVEPEKWTTACPDDEWLAEMRRFAEEPNIGKNRSNPYMQGMAVRFLRLLEVAQWRPTAADIERAQLAVCLSREFDRVWRDIEAGSPIMAGQCGSCDGIARAAIAAVLPAPPATAATEEKP